MASNNILSFSRYRYLKLSLVLTLASMAAYVWHEPAIAPGGGTWLGYVLGSIAALLVVALLLFGLRKRAYRSRLGQVRGWLSAHVYLGLSLIVIATLHTGFEFGANVHTLAYVLMLAVIVSGMWGVVVYFRNPSLMSGLLEGKSLLQHGAALHDIDRQSSQLAAHTDADIERLIKRSAEARIVGRFFGRLRGDVLACPTRRAVTALEQRVNQPTTTARLRQLYALQFQRLAVLNKIRGFVRLKAWTDLWLMFHVPLSFGLLAALVAHIVAVFFYW